MSRLRLAFLAASACVIAAAQTPFRVDVRLINVAVAVRDASGRLIPDLTQDDFEILEDGVPQKIAFFARSKDVPLNLGLVVDISGSQGPFVKAHQKDLKIFLETILSARDRAFLVCFGNHPRLITEFTSSPRQLVDALDGFVHAGGRTVYPMLGPPEVRTAGTAFFDALYHSANQMFQNVERGRKALIAFSDGEDNSSAHHEMEAIEIAQANDVLLFCVRYTEVHNGRWNARNKYGRAVMERMAAETGGGEYDAQEKGLADNFRQIGEQLRGSYELAYHSSNPESDGTFRKIKIRVKRPGLTVRSKSGYYSRPS
jgi:Ca-activated chloride channel family protein